MNKIRVFLLITILVVGGFSILVFSKDRPAPLARVWPIKNWTPSTLEEQGMDTTKLDAMTSWVVDSGVDVDSVLIVRHGYMVYERYFNPKYGVNSTHVLQSVSKSFTSAIVGVAVDRGLIHLDDKVLDYFPELTIQNRDPWKDAMTVRDLLTMTGGLQWDEWSMSYENPMNDLSLMRMSPNPYQYLLDRPMVDKPGEKWVYNTGITNLLSDIVRRATGSDFLEYGVENIFQPLNITRYCWFTDEGGTLPGREWALPDHEGHGEVRLPLPQQRHLEREAILSHKWVSESVRPISEPDPGEGYGYQWWSFPDLGVYYACGRHEQSIYVSPKMDLVVAITGNVTDGHAKLYSVDNTILNRYVLPACANYSHTTLTYQRNNITVTYPAGAFIHESENGSMHQIIETSSNEYNILSFGKIATHETELSQEMIEVVFKTAKVAENQSDYVLGNLTSTSSGDHKATLQPFTLTVSGSPVEGVIGYWYCPETGRHFFMLHLMIDEKLVEERVKDDFEHYFVNLTCH